MAAASYTVDDLNVPLGREPKKQQRVTKLDVPQVLAGLALCLAVVMLWMAIRDDLPTRKSTAVALANPRIAAQPVGPAAIEVGAPPTITPDRDNRAASVLPSDSTMITIFDAKTGEKKEVVVSAPARAVASPSTKTSNSMLDSGKLGEKDRAIAPADRSVLGPDTSESLPDLRGAVTVAADAPSIPVSSTPIPSLLNSNDSVDEVIPALASLNGSIPLPRRRPAQFGLVQNAAISSVPLPRMRPQEAPGPEAMNAATAELANGTSGYEPGLNLGR